MDRERLGRLGVWSFIDGRSLRLPTIVVRPGKPNKAASSFASGIIREPLTGRESLCPVTPDATMWILSPRRVVESFLLAIENASIAPSEEALVAAVSASISQRVARLETTGLGSESAEETARRIQGEIRLAQELQRSILPSSAPAVPGVAVGHLYEPSSEVGGDYYDFYLLSQGRLLVAVGDASGHGLDSSMVSSMAKSAKAAAPAATS